MEILRETYREQNQWRKAAGSAWANEWNLVFTKDLGRYIVPQTAVQADRGEDRQIMQGYKWGTEHTVKSQVGYDVGYEIPSENKKHNI